MIIDSMDILHSSTVEGFALVSSDSDFTGLAQRLREASKKVIGFGRRQTPQPFVTACNRFIYVENLNRDEAKIITAGDDGASLLVALAPGSGAVVNVSEGGAVQGVPGGETLADLLDHAVELIAKEDGWTDLSSMGQMLLALRPDFDVRSYGAKKFRELVQAQGRYEIRVDGTVTSFRPRE